MVRGGGIDDEGPLQLVGDLGKLAHGSAEQRHHTQKQGWYLAHLDRVDTGHQGKVCDGVALCAGGVGRYVPWSAPRPFVGGDHDEQPCDVLDVSPAVQRVRAGQDLHALPGQQTRDDPIAEMTLRAGSDVVAGADFGGSDPASLMTCQCLGPHLSSHMAFGPTGLQRCALCHRGRNCAVAIEVAGSGQHRSGALRGVKQGGGQRWPVARPPVIGRGSAVVQGDSATADVGQRSRVGGIAAHQTYSGDVGAGTRTRDHDDLLTAIGQQAGGGRADGAGTDDDVLGHDVSS